MTKIKYEVVLALTVPRDVHRVDALFQTLLVKFSPQFVPPLPPAPTCIIIPYALEFPVYTYIFRIYGGAAEPFKSSK